MEGMMKKVELQHVSLNLPAMRELGAKWLVEMADYISQNPQFITNAFCRVGYLKLWIRL